MSGAKPVHEAWVDVMTAVQRIGKGERNAQQGYQFRGVDATVNAVGPELRNARVFIRPRRILERVDERYETSKGAQMRNVTLRIEWEVTGPAGDSFTGESVGEAADSGDKAASKAHSVAYRTYLLEALCIPTGERDPDADVHERAARMPPKRSSRDWQKEAEQATTIAGVRALWKLAKDDGELTDDLAAILQRRSEALTASDGGDPWTSAAKS